MALDEPRNPKHAAIAESPDHPEWLRMAKRQEAEDREARRVELEQRAECESVEATESHWSGVFGCDPYPDVHYDGRPGIDHRLHNVSGMNHAGGS